DPTPTLLNFPPYYHSQIPPHLPTKVIRKGKDIYYGSADFLAGGGGEAHETTAEAPEKASEKAKATHHVFLGSNQELAHLQTNGRVQSPRPFEEQ
ncbi:hypothetical protein Goshw_019993, partial [Gossypium schwendimanii]|nr:hypothetical protein [Gossypium schwendimanii]